MIQQESKRFIDTRGLGYNSREDPTSIKRDLSAMEDLLPLHNGILHRKSKADSDGLEISRSSGPMVAEPVTTHKIGNAVFPAKIKMTMTNIMGYAFWNGTIDRSTSDIPVLLNADTA
jgi:hypothetical protein